MKKEELDTIEIALLKEKIKKERIIYLQESKDVEEYLHLLGMEKQKHETIREILSRIINDYKFTNTNNIWVLTSAFKRFVDSCYEDTYTYLKEVDLLDKSADGRKYTNIENLYINVSFFDKKNGYDSVKEFEKNNIVINPRNNKDNMNGLSIVRNEFIMNSINFGEEKSKELLLKKYPRL